ncbi:MAG TPA: metalloregulator ArsR/SmtB family transcription factor [Thermoleophilaceae bacterium]
MATKTSVAHPLSPLLVELIAQRFRVIGEPMRIRLLDHLRTGPASVGALSETLGATQQNVSKHLGVLLQAGIVAREKRGNHALYSIVDESVFELCEQVCGGLRRRIDELDGVLPVEAA